ncbi:MAG TPA: signal peptide peptidase SppA [Propionibacteriaceae bacterium]|jgi:protease-4|nr:signal peptide peptidase SppA [Propionibacteriaceae bacterium]
MAAFPGRRPQTLLELDLTEPLVAPEADDPLARLRARSRRLLRPTLRALHEAAEDRHVVGLIAKVGGMWPWATMQELRRGVQAFGASGKPTLAWVETFGELGSRGMAAYVLATAFGELWLQPGGEVGLLGVGIEQTFVRGTLDRLGIEPQFEQRYEYKNAADVLVRKEFTAAHREALERLSESVFSDAVDTIADARGLTHDQVRELINTGPRTAPEAQAAGLVDRLGYRDQAYEAMRTRTDRKPELLFADRWRPRRKIAPPPHRRDHVAVVDVRGGIATGRTRRGPMGRQAGSDTVSAQLRAAHDNDRARAVVMRVESPGGSAVASEVIWREVFRLREAGKPVVVSMGDVAASGGYYISCPAEVIVALSATLTGSIGVLGGKLVVDNLLERLGVSTGTVQQGAHALMYSARRGFSEDERARFAATVDAIYHDFVGKVAEGRRRPVADIEAVARGRVWTGRDALEAGLVDELGGLRDAVRIARERAKLPEDAPVLGAIRIPPLARLSRPRNSEDPRTWASAGWLGPLTSSGRMKDLTDVAAALGLPADATLRMPAIDLQ